ncbi:pimeloyl-ACP methyl ester carboxylesterase/uncharacterized protein YukE [Prauserella isguenensis]|uniref:Pimeloyl-ACP methyl ester carboxylesterase/uncharacterized protein YukE n=1 Tax=Prauserella isguenensis TaxID=1470180 RepID=A0A839RWX2_9PSEU|nr:pimeloyl-ACP methyl ester carboxylesterase/uncharacterized protein YukE [Prauserella isguenensis]
MVSYEQLRAAEPDAFDNLANKWSRLAGELSSTDSDLGSAARSLEGWSGEAADTARSHVTDVRGGYATAAEYMEKIPPALRTLSDAVSDAQKTVNGVVETVESSGHLRVQTDGTVRAIPGGPGDMRSDDEKQAASDLADELTGKISRALSAVNEADRTAVSALTKATPEAAGLELEATGADHVITPSDIPSDASPAEVKEWWDGLSPTEQESAVYTHGDVIGGMDGIPAEDRDRANRLRFAEEYTHLTGRRDELEELGPAKYSEEATELEEIDRTLNGLEPIQERLEREPTGTRPQAYLLDFATDGNGRGVVATGNPDTADNVVTSVPGTGANLSNIGGELDRADALLDQAAQTDRGSRNAAITWVGYDAPQDLNEATRAGYAEDAAGDLRSFQDGLRATHEGQPSTNTLIGHSYGSTVVGHSAQGGHLDVDNAVFIGSPGVGADHVSELDLPDDANVYAGTAENDIIRNTPPFIHDNQPINEDFGAEVFDAGEGTDSWYGTSPDAHSEYWDENSTPLRNLGRIVVGESPSS